MARAPLSVANQQLFSVDEIVEDEIIWPAGERKK